MLLKRIPVLFLQVALVLFGLVVLALLIVMPLKEGRAQDLDLWSVYTDPFILFGYAASIAFFVGLYYGIRLLHRIGNNSLFSPPSGKLLRTMRVCTLILGLCVVLAGMYIRLFHHPDDDPAGFLALCIAVTFALLVVTAAISVVEKLLRKAIELQSENELTI